MELFLWIYKLNSSHQFWPGAHKFWILPIQVILTGITYAACQIRFPHTATVQHMYNIFVHFLTGIGKDGKVL